jgi:transposase
MVRRHELTDAMWQRIEPLLPANGNPGGRWADHRKVINGVLFRARMGVPWPDLPDRYGPWQTGYERHRRWSADGTWRRILPGVQIEADRGARVARAGVVVRELGGQVDRAEAFGEQLLAGGLQFMRLFEIADTRALD